MISKLEFVNYLAKNLSYTYDETNNTLTDTIGQQVNADALFTIFKKKTGQSFECLYDEHVSCFSVLRCTECGTVIFEHYDEEYDPNLKCPVCTNYQTTFKYYTKQNIEQDENKQKEIEMYLQFAKSDREADERYVKRGGLYDWEKTHKKTLFKSSKYMITVQLTGLSKWDLQAEINISKRKDNDMVYTCKHHIKIPLSPYTMWFFIKHKVKCKVTWENV